MQFIDSAPLYRIVRITGPQHNMLGLQLSDTPISGPPAVEVLDGGGLGLEADDVAAAVWQGVALAARQFGRTYPIDKIQFVSSDSAPASIYRELALELIRRIEAEKGLARDGAV